MSIERHPALENLVSCSAGSMPEALAAVMASHISLCKRCRRELAIMETIGASLLDEVPSASLTPGIAILRDFKEPKALASGEGDVLNGSPKACRPLVQGRPMEMGWLWRLAAPDSAVGTSPSVAAAHQGFAGIETSRTRPQRLRDDPRLAGILHGQYRHIRRRRRCRYE